MRQSKPKQARKSSRDDAYTSNLFAVSQQKHMLIHDAASTRLSANAIFEVGGASTDPTLRSSMQLQGKRAVISFWS
ncbi:hypothetical protein MAUB1S_08266 [Mycolicibacterium aubagnense]